MGTTPLSPSPRKTPAAERRQKGGRCSPVPPPPSQNQRWPPVPAGQSSPCGAGGALPDCAGPAATRARGAWPRRPSQEQRRRSHLFSEAAQSPGRKVLISSAGIFRSHISSARQRANGTAARRPWGEAAARAGGRRELPQHSFRAGGSGAALSRSRQQRPVPPHGGQRCRGITVGPALAPCPLPRIPARCADGGHAAAAPLSPQLGTVPPSSRSGEAFCCRTPREEKHGRGRSSTPAGAQRGCFKLEGSVSAAQRGPGGA